jgi:hypothetical protein
VVREEIADGGADGIGHRHRDEIFPVNGLGGTRCHTVNGISNRNPLERLWEKFAFGGRCSAHRSWQGYTP